MSSDPSALMACMEHKKLIVFVGSGGVGKTTTATLTAMAAAQRGKKVLVLTVDPSKRLADLLGVSQNLPHPVEVSPKVWQCESLCQTDVSPSGANGSLSAWLLDPKRVADQTVETFVQDLALRERFFKNPIYHELSGVIAGMQEYTALKALHTFWSKGQYDLIILDTPPSQHALDFLEAPERLKKLLDGKVFQLLLGGSGKLSEIAAEGLYQLFKQIFSEHFATEIRNFFETFGELLKSLGTDLSQMKAHLQSKETCFLLVTRPWAPAVGEALELIQATRARRFQIEGVFLNQTWTPFFKPDQTLSFEKEQIISRVNLEQTLFNQLNNTMNQSSFPGWVRLLPDWRLFEPEYTLNQSAAFLNKLS